MQKQSLRQKQYEPPPIIIDGRKVTYDEWQQLLTEYHDYDRLWLACKIKACKRHRRCSGRWPESMDFDVRNDEVFWILQWLAMGRPPEIWAEAGYTDLQQFLKVVRAQWLPHRLVAMRQASSG